MRYSQVASGHRYVNGVHEWHECNACRPHHDRESAERAEEGRRHEVLLALSGGLDRRAMILRETLG